MSLRICTYNVEWFDDLFTANNAPITDPGVDAKKAERIEALATVFTELNADIIGIVEAPNTKRGTQRTVDCLEAFAAHAGLRTTTAIIGFASPGRQELALLFDPQVVMVRHAPGGRPGTKSKPPFNERFEYDTDDDRIKEIYKFYRPPLEAKITLNAGGGEFHLMLVHTKSKGIFSSADMVHWNRESQRNRRKLFAECAWIRQRVDEWRDAGHRVVVMGDVNDGPEMDSYEASFGRSAVEIIMGDIFGPKCILLNPSGRPKWKRYGWEPASTSFRDRFTETRVSVLIDHIMVSQDLALAGGEPWTVWNPYQRRGLDRSFKNAPKAASDHFPITLDIAP